jgi:hypothetical protein
MPTERRDESDKTVGEPANRQKKPGRQGGISTNPPEPSPRGKQTSKEEAVKLTRKLSIGLAAMLVLGAMSSFAQAGSTKGTWTYTDLTPDESVIANSDATQHCHGNLPAGPADVNSFPFKAPRTGTLKLVSNNALDWAMEVQTSSGSVITGTDGANPNDPENMTVRLRPGKYNVVYCNAAGEPSITVNYSFK